MCTEAGRRLRAQAGLSLLELIMVIVIVSVALTGVLSVFVTTAKGSADPMVRMQAQLVAEAYLEEILLKGFVDPEDSPDDQRVCPTKEASRTAYDNVCDYSGLTDSPPQDQFGTPLAGLTGYTVSVTVTPSPADPTGAVTLGSLSNDYVNGYIRVLRVDVTVSGSGGVSITLSGYRTNYNCDATIDLGKCRPLS